MDAVNVRAYKPEDMRAVIALAKRNLLDVNTKDYPKELMEKLASRYTEEYMAYLSEKGHSYVALYDGAIVGCGTVMPFWGKEKEECVLLSIYVHPDRQNRGIGRCVMAALEADSYFERSKRAEIPASITACGFYEKCGYRYKDGKKEPDSEGIYPMEKFRRPGGCGK